MLGNRVKEWLDLQLLEVQCGFRPGRGCVDAAFSLRQLHENAVRRGQKLITSFIDLSKAYDSINRPLAWQVFERRGMPPKLVALLRDLHQGTSCALKEDHKSPSSWFEVKTGFKQGDVNAPMLFNLFIDTVMRCLEPVLRQSGIKFIYRIDGQLRECSNRDLHEIAWALMYADDIALMTETEEQMQAALELVDCTFSQWGLELSIKKTKVMGVGCPEPSDVVLSRGCIQAVSQFKYLGGVLSSDNMLQSELAMRISKAAGAFHRLRKLWGDAHLARTVKCSVYKSIVLATLLYGCEAWSASQSQIAELQTFHMRCLRRICRISLWQKKTNQEIMGLCGMEAIGALISYRRLRWLGHMARMADDRLPKQLLFGGIALQSKPSVGRPPKCWQDYVREDLARLQMPYNWYKLAQDRETWRCRIQRLLVHI